MLLKLLDSIGKAVALKEPERPKMLDPGGDFRPERAYVGGDKPARIPVEDTEPEEEAETLDSPNMEDRLRRLFADDEADEPVLIARPGKFGS